MGLLDSLFGGGSTKTTTKSTFGSDVDALQKGLTKGISQGINPYLSNPNVFVAPMNDYQTGVGLGARGLVDYAYGSNGAGSLGNYADAYRGLMDQSDVLGQVGALNGYVGTSGAGGLDSYIPGFSQQAIDASTYDMGDIMGYANPYADALNSSAQRNLTDAYNTTQSDIGARAAAGGAFGGSGEAIERAQAAKNYMRQATDTATQIQSDAYGIGAQLAGNNANARSAALQNAGNDIYGRAAGARSYDASQMDALYNRGLGAATFDNNQRSDAYTRQLQALSGASGYDLSKAGYDENAKNNYLTRSTSSLGLLGGYGDQFRSYQQEVGDAPYTQFQRFSGFIPGYQPTTTTKTPQNGGGLLGAGLTALGAFGF